MNKLKFYKILTICLLTLLLGVFTQCISNAPVNSDATSSASRKPSSNPVANPPKSEEQVLNLTQVSTGIKNHEQLLHTYAELTSISPVNASVVTVYRDVESSLPTNNDVKVFSAAGQVAITRLAAEFCSLLVDSAALNGMPTARPQVFTTFNIDQLRLTQIDNQKKMDTIANMMDLFWGEGMLSPEEFDAAGDELLFLFDELAVGEPDTAASSKKVFKGVCTSILSSAYVTLI